MAGFSAPLWPFCWSKSKTLKVTVTLTYHSWQPWWKRWYLPSWNTTDLCEAFFKGLTITQKDCSVFLLHFAGWICQQLFWTWPSHCCKVFDGRTRETSCRLCPGIFSLGLSKTKKANANHWRLENVLTFGDESNCLMWRNSHSTRRLQQLSALPTAPDTREKKGLFYSLVPNPGS